MKYPNPYELQSIDVAYRIVDNFLYISQQDI